jgi:hypothetical protein
MHISINTITKCFEFQINDPPQPIFISVFLNKNIKSKNKQIQSQLTDQNIKDIITSIIPMQKSLVQVTISFASWGKEN